MEKRYFRFAFCVLYFSIIEWYASQEMQNSQIEIKL